MVTWAGGAQSSSLRLPPGAPSLWGGTPSSRPSGGRPLDSLPAQWDLPRLVAAPADGSFPSATLAHRPLSFGCAQETSQVKAPQGAPGGLQSHRPRLGSLSSLVPCSVPRRPSGRERLRPRVFSPAPAPERGDGPRASCTGLCAPGARPCPSAPSSRLRLRRRLRSCPRLRPSHLRRRPPAAPMRVFRPPLTGVTSPLPSAFPGPPRHPPVQHVARPPRITAGTPGFRLASSFSAPHTHSTEAPPDPPSFSSPSPPSAPGPSAP